MRDPNLLSPLVVQSSWCRLGDDSWLWRFQHYPLHIFRSIDAAPVHRRGWGLQEWTLSRRNIHFGRDVIYWECRLRLASESAEHHKNPRLGLPYIPKQIDELLNDESNILSHWTHLVERYSQATLTKAEDKLVAISALAREMQAVLEFRSNQKFTYIAGVWSPYLVQQLMWQRRTRQCLVRPRQYRAPSWSWASVDGPLDYRCCGWNRKKVGFLRLC